MKSGPRHTKGRLSAGAQGAASQSTLNPPSSISLTLPLIHFHQFSSISSTIIHFHSLPSITAHFHPSYEGHIFQKIRRRKISKFSHQLSDGMKFVLWDVLSGIGVSDAIASKKMAHTQQIPN